MNAEKTVKVGIVGGTGYTGVELLRMLTLHPNAKVTMITSRKDAGTRLDAMFPSLRGRCDLVFSDTATADLTQCDLVFYATPHGVAMADAPKLTAAGVKIIDLAADFRFKDLAALVARSGQLCGSLYHCSNTAKSLKRKSAARSIIFTPEAVSFGASAIATPCGVA